jgi:hypothetical protein
VQEGPAQEDPGLVGLERVDPGPVADLVQEVLRRVADPGLGDPRPVGPERAVGLHLPHQHRTKTHQEHMLPIKGRKSPIKRRFSSSVRNFFVS